MTTRSHNDSTGFWIAVLFLIGLWIALAAVLKQEPADEDVDSARYCDMVYRHKQDPSVGWPDYDGVYDSMCIKGELRPHR